MLTDKQLQNLKPTDKTYKKHDSGGLYIQVAPTGSRLWRMKYKINGKERVLSFGIYPAVTISDARAMRDLARVRIRAGEDPAPTKARQDIAVHNTSQHFETVARAWCANEKARWSQKHAADVIHSLEKEVFPSFGEVEIQTIKPKMVLTLIKEIEERSSSTAKKIRQRISGVFDYAIASDLTEDNPAERIAKAMAPRSEKPQPAITNLFKARQLLRDVAAAKAQPTTKLAVYLQALTAVRPNEVRGAKWNEFNLKSNQSFWRIPDSRMKTKKEHIVPLSTQALDILRELKKLTGKYEFLFPSTRSAHVMMSENAMGYLLNRIGYKDIHVPHGWRSTFSSIMNEHYPTDRAIIDLMLAHSIGGGGTARPASSSEAAYNRAEHIERRSILAQLWADLLLIDVPKPEELLSGPRK